MRFGRLAPLLVVAVLGIAACSSDDDSSSNAAEDTTTRATSVSTTTTSATSTTESTTGVTIGIICSSPADAASSLVSAWSADDRTAALRCTSEEVVDRLFQVSGAGNTWTDQGCDASDPSAPVCAYSYEGGAAFLTTTGSDADGWKVTGLRYVAD
jgi:hypothetical protein